MNVCRCILSKFYIKPQRLAVEGYSQAVVSYRNSTSNHNTSRSSGLTKRVVSYRNSTSNHNIGPNHSRSKDRCILSKFYIKPQRRARKRYVRNVVSYRNSTSNHNDRQNVSTAVTVVSYRNSTSNHNVCKRITFCRLVVSYRNSTSNHNSGLNASLLVVLYLIEILHQTTTLRRLRNDWFVLYLIEILHQTTTAFHLQ